MKAKVPAARTSFAPAFLRFCLILAAALLVIAAAAGEASENRSWEDRLAAAREKYNRKTVNVYTSWRPKYKRDRINVCFYPSENRPYIDISIRESLEITDEAEMEAILEVVTLYRYYSVEEYGTISFMKAEWIAHNLVHQMATGSPEQQKMVELLLGEDVTEIIRHSKELDLSPLGNMPENQKTLYEMIEFVYGLNRQ